MVATRRERANLNIGGDWIGPGAGCPDLDSDIMWRVVLALALLVVSVEGACDPSCATCSTYKPVTAVECVSDHPAQADWDSYKIDDGDSLIVSKAHPDTECVGWNELFERLELQACDANRPTPCQRWDLTTDAYTRGGKNCTANTGEKGGCLDIRSKVGPGVQLTKCYDQPNDRFAVAGGSWFSEAAPPTFPQRCLEANVQVCASASCCTSCGPGRHLTKAGYCDLDAPPPKTATLFVALPTNDTLIDEELLPVLEARRDSYHRRSLFSSSRRPHVALAGTRGSRSSGSRTATRARNRRIARRRTAWGRRTWRWATRRAS